MAINIHSYKDFVRHLNQVFSLIQTHNPPQRIIIYGNEEYFLSRTVIGLKKIWKEAIKGDISEFEGPVRIDSMQHLLERSLFSESKFITSRIKDKRELEQMAAFAKQLSADDCILIRIDSTKISEKDIASNFENAEVLCCNTLTSDELRIFCGSLLRNSNLKVADDAINRIVESTNSSPALVEQCINQLSLLFAGRSDIIRAGDLPKMWDMLPEKVVFQLSNLLLANDAAGAYVLIERLLDQGNAPLAILGVLNRHLKNLKLAWNKDSKGLARLPRTVVQAYQRAASARQVHDIQASTTRLLDAEKALKSTSINPELVLNSVVAEFVQSPGH